MSSFELHLTGYHQPELHRTVFSHSQMPATRVAVRGKTGAALAAEHTFQWTQAVRALTAFLIRNAAWAESGSTADDKPLLTGAEGSPAASLDFALSKQPQWLRDIFGEDRRRRTFARRVLQRSNPERKRPGPVVLSLNENTLLAAEISVLVGEVVIRDAQTLLSFAHSIEHGLAPSFASGSAASSGAPSFHSLDTGPVLTKQMLERMIESEISAMIWKTDIFNSSRIREVNGALAVNPSITKLLSREKRFVGDLDLSLNSAERLGMGLTPSELQRAVNRDEPIRVVAPWIQIGALALFEYLRRMKGLHLEIDYQWCYTAEIRRAVTLGTVSPMPDLFVLGIGPAATAISQSPRIPYRPLMLLPSISHKILMHRSAFQSGEPSINHGEYKFLCQEASTPEFCFEDMERRGLVSKSRVSISHLEPDEAPGAFGSGDPDLRMLMFFPHYNLNELFNDCRAVRIPGQQTDVKESVLFAGDSFLADARRARYLDIALRNAWLELRQCPAELSRLVQQLVAEQNFVRFLSRFAGLHNIRGLSIEGLV